MHCMDGTGIHWNRGQSAVCSSGPQEERNIMQFKEMGNESGKTLMLLPASVIAVLRQQRMLKNTVVVCSMIVML